MAKLLSEKSMKYNPGPIGIILVLGLIVFFLPPNVIHSRGQTVIQLGGDFDLARSRLAKKGYYRIDLVGQGFTKFQVEACLNGVRYWFKSDNNGNINKKRKIGACQPDQPILSKKRIRQILASYGYNRIKIEQHANINVAVLCFGNDRLRVEINQQGQVGNRRLIGNCRNSLSISDITATLQNEGYDQIRFINKRPPVYVVEACHNSRKYSLELNEYADTLSRNSIGNCRAQLEPRNITRFLKNLGFSRISVISDRLPTYIAEVCENRTRVELSLNRYGNITDRVTIGKCARKISARQLIRNMRDQGYIRINIKRETNRGYIAHACRSGQLYRNKYDVFGTLQDERQKGPCPSWSIRQVKEQLAKYKYRKLKFYVEGCRKGKLIRFQVNEFGDRSNRQIIGNCN